MWVEFPYLKFSVQPFKFCNFQNFFPPGTQIEKENLKKKEDAN